MKRKHTIVAIIIIGLIAAVIPPCTAYPGTYSITQSSKYTLSTDGTPLEKLVPIHLDISSFSDPDISQTKINMNRAGWKLRFHHNSEDTKMEDFKNEIDKSDIHFHAGHGINIPNKLMLPLGVKIKIPGPGGHMELKDHPFPNSAVTPDDVKGKWNHCKWFAIHSCHVLEDRDWAGVLKKSNSHGILGFGSIAYTTGHFLADFSNLITQDWPMVKAWQKASIDNMNKYYDDIITVRTFFKNEAQCIRDKLNKPSPVNDEDIIMCDVEIGHQKTSWDVFMTSLKTGKTKKWEMGEEDYENNMNFPIEKASQYYDMNRKTDL